MPSAEEIANAQKYLLHYSDQSLDIVNNQTEIRRLSKGSVCMATLWYMYVVFVTLFTYILNHELEVDRELKNNKMAIFIAIIFGVILPAMLFKFGLDALEEHLNKEVDAVSDDVAKYYAAKDMFENHPMLFETDALKVEFVKSYTKGKSDIKIVYLPVAIGLVMGFALLMALSYNLPDPVGIVLGFVSAIVFVVFSSLRVANGQIKTLEDFKNTSNNHRYDRYVMEMSNYQEKFVEYFDNRQEFRDILRRNQLSTRV